MEGAVVSTANVVLGPTAPARLPTASVPVPEVIEMPRVPLPVKLESVTVRVVPEPVTSKLPALAVPVEFTVILPTDKLDDEKLASEYVMV